MTCSVHAAMMGFFSKNGGGKGIAPGDVCFTLPTPPAGPIPVPYINITFSADLVSGSKTVQADGSPTALEDKSKTSTSTGDEPGNQPGGVMSARHKGEGVFSSWSFTVKIEGSGVACMGDMMKQNANGTVLNAIDPAALVLFAMALAAEGNLKPCGPDKPYKRKQCVADRPAAQRDAVNGKDCWECKQEGAPNPGRYLASGDSKLESTRGEDGEMEDKEYMTHDHQPPCSLAWELGGCHMDYDKFKALFAEPEMVRPHCRTHSNSQGTAVKKTVSALRKG